MNKIAICSTTLEFTDDVKEQVKARLKISDLDFFSNISLTNQPPYYKEVSSDSCYNFAEPEFRNRLYKIMMICEEKKKAELRNEYFYEGCFLIEKNFLDSKFEIQMPDFLLEHKVYGIPALIQKQKFEDRWREKFDTSSDFFFSDTITFNIICDAYRFLHLPRSFLSFTMLEFQYKYLKMNGIDFYTGIKLV